MNAHVRWMMIGGLAIAAALPGCDIAPREIAPNEEPIAIALENNGMEDQGRFLLSAILDEWPGSSEDEHFSLSTQARGSGGRLFSMQVLPPALIKSPLPLLNAELTGGPAAAPVKLRVIRVKQEPAVAPTMTQLELQRYDGTTWVEGPCGSGKLAIAIPGVFRRDGLHVENASRLTLACLDEGVAAKCTGWGLPSGSSSQDERWDTHQACTRMARADVCGVGQSHTRSHTRIWLYDTLSNNSVPDAVDELVVEPLAGWPPDPSKYYFEAFWRSGEDHAGCFSKFRWAGLREGALCGGLLPDPRLSNDNDGIAEACEDIEIQDAIDEGGALMFNKTQYNDLALWVWYRERPNGTHDYTSTVRGRVDRPAQMTHPFWETEGNAYQKRYPEAYLMRVPPEGMLPSEYASVSTFYNAAKRDRVLARDGDARFAPSRGYVREYHEGYVLVAPRDGARAALRLWYNAATDDYVTLTGEPQGLPGTYAALPDILGYLNDPDGL